MSFAAARNTTLRGVLTLGVALGATIWPGSAFGAPQGATSLVVPEVWIRTGEPLPGVAGSMALEIGAPAADGLGAQAAVVRITNGLGEVEHVLFGRASANDPDGVLLSSESLAAVPGGAQVRDFERFASVRDGQILVGAGLDASATGGDLRRDALFGPAGPVILQGDPVPGLPGQYFGAQLRAQLLPGGEPAFVAELETLEGIWIGSALLRGSPPAVVLKKGTVPGGSTLGLALRGIGDEVSFSPDGQRFAAQVYLAGTSGTQDAALVESGALLIAHGTAVREGEPIPPAAGALPGERFQRFGPARVTDEGRVAWIGETDAPADRDSVLWLDGEIVLREGDALVGGGSLTGRPMGLWLGANGEPTVAWALAGPSGPVPALIHRGRALLVAGAGVDLDGDGASDPGVTWAGFAGAAPIAASGSGELLVAARLDLAGTAVAHDDETALLRLRVPRFADSGLGQALSLSGAGSRGLVTFAPLEPPVDLIWILGSLSGTSPGIPTDAGLLPLANDPYTTLTVSAPGQGLLQGALHAPGAFGVGDASLELPPGVGPSFIGTTLTHAWVGLALAPQIEVTAISEPLAIPLGP